MSYKGSGNYIGTERAYYIDRNNSNHFGSWNPNDAANAIKQFVWAAPAEAFAATGGSISTTSYDGENYHIHSYDAPSPAGITSSFVVTSTGSVGLSFELTARGGWSGGGQGCTSSTPGCSGPAGSAYGGAGAGGRVNLVHNYRLALGTYTIYVGMGTFGTSIHNSDGEEVLRVSQANDGNPASSCQPRGGWPSYANPGPGGSAPPTSDSYILNPGELWFPGVVANSYSGGSGGSGGFSQGGCNTTPSQGGGTGGFPGWFNAYPDIPSNPASYQNVMGPSVLINNGCGLFAGGVPPGVYHPSTNPNTSVGGEYVVGRLRISYPIGPAGS